MISKVSFYEKKIQQIIFRAKIQLEFRKQVGIPIKVRVVLVMDQHTGAKTNF